MRDWNQQGDRRRTTSSTIYKPCPHRPPGNRTKKNHVSEGARPAPLVQYVRSHNFRFTIFLCHHHDDQQKRGWKAQPVNLARLQNVQYDPKDRGTIRLTYTPWEYSVFFSLVSPPSLCIPLWPLKLHWPPPNSLNLIQPLTEAACWVPGHFQVSRWVNF